MSSMYDCGHWDMWVWFQKAAIRASARRGRSLFTCLVEGWVGCAKWIAIDYLRCVFYEVVKLRSCSWDGLFGVGCVVVALAR